MNSYKGEKKDREPAFSWNLVSGKKKHPERIWGFPAEHRGFHGLVFHGLQVGLVVHLREENGHFMANTAPIQHKTKTILEGKTFDLIPIAMVGATLHLNVH